MMNLRSILRIFGITIAYYLTGKLGAQIAIPPGYAAAVWPAAGVALFSLLYFGSGVWPGIFFGCFLVNAEITLRVTEAHSGFMAIAPDLITAAGATGQAFFGKYLVERFIESPWSLDQEVDIIKFITIVCPVGCLISPSLGVFTSCAFGSIPPSDFFYSWGTWWVGDSIGVMIMGPMLILLANMHDRRFPTVKRLFAASPFLVVLAMAFLLFVYVCRWEKRQMRLSFEKRAIQLSTVLQARLDGYESALYSIHSFYLSVPEVNQTSFRTFVNGLFNQYPGVRALAWDVPVAAKDRTRFETSMRDTVEADFEIKEEEQPGRLARAKQESNYVVPIYIEPFASFKSGLGYNLASSPGRLEALEKARDTGSLVATGGIRLVHGSATSPGFMLVLPVYRGQSTPITVEERRQKLVAYIVGGFEAEVVIQTALGGFDREGIDIEIEDSSGASRGLGTGPGPRLGPNVIYSSPTLRRDPSDGTLLYDLHYDLGYDRQVNLAGRTWTVHFFQPHDFLASHRNWNSWVVLVGALLFVGLFGAFLLVVMGRSSRIQSLVDKRTAELAMSEAKFRGLLECAPDSIIVAESDGRILLVNSQTEVMFGYRREELIGLSVEVLFPDRFKASYVLDREKYVREPEARPMAAGHALAGQKKNGIEFPIEVSLSPLVTPDGLLVTSIIRDISERKRAEEVMADQRAKMVASSKLSSLGEMAASIAHEVNTPLTIIALKVSQLRSVLRHDGDGRSLEWLTVIDRTVTRVSKIIRSLRDFARDGTGDPYAGALVKVLVDETLALCLEKFKFRGIELKVLGACHDLWLECRAVEISQVLLNLLNNAYDAVIDSPVKSVVLAIEEDYERVRIAISDSGPGISPALRDTIMLPFFTTKAYGKGTGLGLSISKRIIEDHNGSLILEATPIGAKFVVVLPKVQRLRPSPDLDVSGSLI